MKFILGLFTGVVLGFLFAPASGEETRQMLQERAQRAAEQARQKGREKAGEIGREVGERVFDKAVGEERWP